MNSDLIGTGDPNCPYCDGLGYVVPDVLPGTPGFGRAIACMCRKSHQEMERRETLLKISHIGAFRNHTFDSFITDLVGIPDRMRDNLRKAKSIAFEYANQPKGWLVLKGGYGCGKTHLAAAIANFRLDQGHSVLFINTPDLLDHLRATFNPESTISYDERFEQVRSAPLLILDDLGAQSNSAWAQEKLYQIINHRYSERLATVITTNLDEMDFEPRIRSRLFHEQEVTNLFKIASRDFRRGLTEQDQSDLSTLSLHSHLTFGTFEEGQSNKYLLGAYADAFTYAQALKGEYVEEVPPPWLVLYSTTHGNGKTHLAAAIANYVSSIENNVLFVVVPDLLDYLRGAFDPMSKVGLDKRFDEIRKNSSLVVLDDLGTESATPFVREKLYQLFNYRYVASLPTVITTSTHVDRLDSHLAARMLDTDKCNFISLEVSTYRKPPPKTKG